MLDIGLVITLTMGHVGLRCSQRKQNPFKLHHDKRMKIFNEMPSFRL